MNKQDVQKKNISQVKHFSKKICFSILEIMEDQPNYSISLEIYQLIIYIYFIQLAGYLYYDNERVFTDEYANAKFELEYISTSTYLLSYKDNNNLIYIVFGLMNILMYLQMIYLIYQAFQKIRNKQNQTHKAQKNSSINHFLNSFYFLYQWVLFIPFFEINSGTVGCSSQSFFYDQRDVEDCNFPKAQTVFSCIGMSLALIIGCIIIYFFRNYEFNEKNQLKRRFHIILIPQFILTCFVIYLNYSDSVNFIIKNLVLQTLVISQIYDLFWNLPFRNPKIIIAYLICFVYFEVSFFNYLVLVLDYSISDQGMVQSIAIYTSVISAALIILWNYKYQNVMKMDEKSFIRNYKYLDFYLEELLRISQLSQIDNLNKQKIQQFFISHQKQCTNSLCYCHTLDFQGLRRCVNYDEILNLIDSIFQWSLKQSILIKDKKRCEHVSLKYISFVAKYLNNSTLSYYRLKTILLKEKNNSFYFNSISKLMSKRIELMMEEDIKDMKISSENQNFSAQAISIKSMQSQDQARNKQIPLIVKHIHQKIKFWQSLKRDDYNINYISSQIQSMSLHTQEIGQQFKELHLQYDKQTYAQSPILQKVNLISRLIFFNYRSLIKIDSIYKAIVENDLLPSVLLEKNSQEMLNKQQDQSQEISEYLDLMKGSLVLIQASVVKNPGQILNKNKSQLLNLFQFDQNDSKSLKNINQLMPSFISNIHNDLMRTSIFKGYSPIFSSYNKLFAQNKYGFIIPVKLKVDQLYEQKDDFVLNGSLFHCSTSNQYILLNEYGFIEGISQYMYEILFQGNFTLNKVIQKFNILFLIKNFFNLTKDFEHQDTEQNQKFVSTTSIVLESKNKPVTGSEYYINQQLVSLCIPKQTENQIKKFYDEYDYYIKQNKSEKFKEKDQKALTERQKIKKLFSKYFNENQQNNQPSQKKDFSIRFDLEHKTLKVYDEKNQQFIKHKSYYVMQITEILSQGKENMTIDLDQTNYSPTQHEQFSKQSEDLSIEKSFQASNLNNQNPKIFPKQLVKQDLNQGLKEEKLLKKIDVSDNLQNSKIFDGSNVFNQSIFTKLEDLKKIEISNQNIDNKPSPYFLNYPDYIISPQNQTMSFSPKFWASSHQIISSRQAIQTENTQRDNNIVKTVERETQLNDQNDLREEEIKSDYKVQNQSFFNDPNQIKTGTKIENIQSVQQIKQFDIKRKNNSKLENQINNQASISSGFMSRSKYQNQEIRKIIQIKNISVLRLPFFMINLRFFLFLFFLAIASFITSLKINSIYDQINQSFKIGKFIELFSEQSLMSQKGYMMNQNLLDSQLIQNFSEFINQNLSDVAEQYGQAYFEQFQIINSLQVEIDKQYNVILFSNKQEYSLQMNALEFFLNSVNSIWVLGMGEILNFVNQLYFMIENYLEYFTMISNFNEKTFDSLQNLKSDLTIIYLILIITIIFIVTVLAIIGAYCFYKLVQYKQRIILLVTRLSVKDVDREIQILNYCLKYLQDQSFSWQDFNFPEYILSIQDSSQMEDNMIMHSKINKQKINSKQQIVLNDQALSGADSKSKKRLTTQSSDKAVHRKTKKEQVNSKIQSQSLISSKIQGQNLNQLKLNLIFLTSFIVCGFFYLIILGISYITTQDLDPSFSLLKQTSEFYSNINASLFLSQNMISLPIVADIDKTYPNNNFNKQMNQLLNNIQNIQQFNNNFLQSLKKVTSSSQDDIQYLDNLFTQDICNYFQENSICLEQQNQVEAQSRNIIKNGVSGLITYSLLQLDYILQMLHSYNATQSLNEISEYLNKESEFIFIINSFNLPMQSIRLIFEKVIQMNEATIQKLLNLTIIYFVAIGAILIVIQIIVDVLIKKYIQQNILLHHLSLGLIPIQIQSLETTSQILKSIYNL